MTDDQKKPFVELNEKDVKRYDKQLADLEKKGFFMTEDGVKSTDLPVDVKKKWGKDVVQPKRAMSAYNAFQAKEREAAKLEILTPSTLKCSLFSPKSGINSQRRRRKNMKRRSRRTNKGSIAKWLNYSKMGFLSTRRMVRARLTSPKRSKRRRRKRRMLRRSPKKRSKRSRELLNDIISLL